LTPRARTLTVREQVIANRVQSWRKDPRVAVLYHNAGGEPAAWFEVDGARVYPDVVVGLKDGRWIVEEVATPDSVHEHESGKWHTLSKVRADEVHILVPDRDFRRARNIADRIRGLALCMYTVVGSVVLFQEN
jgi:hypothetical protein